MVLFDIEDKISYKEFLNRPVVLAGRIDHNFSLQDETKIINESGLYSLILTSKLPKAKEIKRWVTSDVLSSIRKHGEYKLQQYQEKSQN